MASLGEVVLFVVDGVANREIDPIARDTDEVVPYLSFVDDAYLCALQCRWPHAAHRFEVDCGVRAVGSKHKRFGA